MSFSDLGLSDALLRAVADSGYDTPTPIQRQAIPSVLMGKDIIAKSGLDVIAADDLDDAAQKIVGAVKAAGQAGAH